LENLVIFKQKLSFFVLNFSLFFFRLLKLLITMAFADAPPADPLALMNTNNSFNGSNDVP
jgi:hypothetical protein